MKRLAFVVATALAAVPAAHAQQIPRYDVAGYCRQLSDTGGGSAIVYNGCIDMEQNAYNKRKPQWPSLPAKTRAYCDSLARMGGGGSYMVLDGCIDMEIGAAGSAPEFKY
ncbi:MAG: hypothetical protein EOS22_04655 [Mesorhizobium sp.]|uniref:hypothetical protein n=1 Tax=Mesorhizobium sp. TaxID=1871066 RepID=UPI000FE6E8A0|nr:hypothetical protein [Mesorhizobium sp.]RWD31317.1 MAG: hypothetical protein EOS22_04655 [Mesorhizobium sp.]TJW70769.1 MAG: hypothetical protein E5V29_03410 [Mesorhizobium sp.]